MQIIRTFERGEATKVGWAARVLLLSTEVENGPITRALAGLSSVIDVVDELFAALSEVLDDPAGYALLVVDCDSDCVGGLEAAERAVIMLSEVMSRVPVILISQECRLQQFPADRLKPTLLRAPLSAVSMKVGFEHALRDRLGV